MKENHEVYRLTSKKPHIISLMLLSAFATMGAILMTPALPNIAHYFSISIGSAQLTVTSFLLGYALGQLLYGPIANRFGRKPAFYIGIGVATLGSLFSILSSPFESFPLLIVGRLLEALGSSAGLVVCFAVINDFYFENQSRRITSMLMLAFAIAPGVAVAVGGALTQYISWQSCFYFLFLYGLVLLIPAWRLPETIHEYDKSACNLRAIFKNYKRLFKNKRLIGFALCSGFSSAAVYVFGAEGPFIGIHILQISPSNYGFLGLIPYLGVLLGCFIVIRMSSSNPVLVLKIAFLIELASTIIMLICFLVGYVSLISLLLPMALFCIGHPMIAGTALSLAMAETQDKGNGSAVMSFIAMAMPVFMTLLLGLLHINASWIMPLLFLIALTLMASGYFFLVVRTQPAS